jgi:hypothetical protein
VENVEDQFNSWQKVCLWSRLKNYKIIIIRITKLKL